MGRNTKENRLKKEALWEWNMDLGRKFGLMEAHILENGNIILKMELEFSHIQMGIITREKWKMVNHMEKVN